MKSINLLGTRYSEKEKSLLGRKRKNSIDRIGSRSLFTHYFSAFVILVIQKFRYNRRFCVLIHVHPSFKMEL
jgi:hypothetical protein